MEDRNQKAHRFTITVAGKELAIETGKLAGQAGGAVTARVGDTLIFATATMSPTAREETDFFPLSVDYEEKLYAAGRIPGSYFRREGRPAESSILISRVIDRTLRPLFPKDMRNDVQVILLPFSYDLENPVDMLGIIAASAALMISNIPWNGPVAGARIGLINGELVVNPTYPELVNSSLDLRLSGTADAINMVECGANEVDEETLLKAMDLGHQTLLPILELQRQMQQQLGKEKAAYVATKGKSALLEEVAGKVRPAIRQIGIEKTERQERNSAIEQVREALVEEYESRNATIEKEEERIPLKEVREVLNEIVKQEVRRRIIEDGIRPDGRDCVTIRPLSVEVGLIPRVHGSALFSRGETQVMTITTLGTPRDSQELDDLSPMEHKRYLHHYNFPPYCTGETYPLRGTRRREVGHGALAEAALRNMIPAEDVFPYTIRLVSEVLSSNGSTSMGSVCASTLSLMDAGVPIIRPVAGIAMGLIKEADKHAILTDIQGLEDHMGDMDFKVAGTEKGVTALQMDIKIAGLPREIIAKALGQARDARLQILEVMSATIPEPRKELGEYAPRMITIKIDPEKIGALIGPGGKIIRGIQERTNTKIDIENDGTVFIAGVDASSTEIALEEIRNLTEEAEIGRIYTGTVTRVESYGVFVEFLPGQEGMVHISQLADYHVARAQDEVQLGDEIMVMVIDVDHDGKVRLSRQAVLEGWTAEEARQRDRKGSGGGRRDSGHGGGGRGGGRGGDRRSDSGGRRDSGRGGRPPSHQE